MEVIRFCFLLPATSPVLPLISSSAGFISQSEKLKKRRKRREQSSTIVLAYLLRFGITRRSTKSLASFKHNVEPLTSAISWSRNYLSSEQKRPL